MLVFMPSIIFSKSHPDTLILEKIFMYREKHMTSFDSTTNNIYLKYSFQVKKRNPTLFLVPTMYTIAKGQRNYVGETYGKITFKDINDYSIERQVTAGSLASYRKTMPIILNYIIPNTYNISLFEEHVLSPFHRSNKRFYKYRIKDLTSSEIYISFRPRINNTQLIRGSAIVDLLTGRIKRLYLRGEYDMIKFEINTDMGSSNRKNPLLPISCDTKATFKFLGNNIKASFAVSLDCATTLPDSISNISDIEFMDSIRPYPLTKFENEVYSNNEKEKQASDSVKNKKAKNSQKFKEMALDIIGDHMLGSIGTETPKASIKFSPLLNPLYLSYSRSRGVAYKIKMGAKYRFNQNRNILFTPQLGYNFKIKKFYYTVPLRYTYNVKKNAWLELTWQNGNRITNSSVLDMIRNERRDSIDFSALELDYFDDEVLQLKNNISISKQFDLTVGCVYHERTAVNKREMKALGKPTAYRSFAPQITLGFHPYKNGPVFTANYERSLRGFLGANIKYERWEFDTSFKKKLTGLRSYSIRAGGGFYTDKSSDYFVDFSNFHENYLPDGWDDDWTGNFQLLNSQWYNASRYYARFNTSYESPMLLLTWMPLVGKYIETERLYVSALQIEHIKPYFEVGYGFTNRYFSIGLFGSFINGKYYESGCKFTFELFRKW